MAEESFKVKVSKYMSYLLRHNPKGLNMDSQGFVKLDELLKKLNERFRVDKRLLFEVVEKSERKRFEIRNGKIRALYGHSIPIKLRLKEDKTIKILYHGTTSQAVAEILKSGLKPMGRNWVHLSPTIEIARQVGLRRTRKPVIIAVDVEKARRNGIKFYKATEHVYLCREIPPKHVKKVSKEGLH